MGHYMLNATLVTILGGVSVVVAQLPTETIAGDFSKYGISGLLLFIVWWLIAKTIPDISAKHNEAWKDVGDKIDNGTDRMIEAILKNNGPQK